MSTSGDYDYYVYFVRNIAYEYSLDFDFWGRKKTSKRAHGLIFPQADESNRNYYKKGDLVNVCTIRINNLPKNIQKQLGIKAPNQFVRILRTLLVLLGEEVTTYISAYKIIKIKSFDDGDGYLLTERKIFKSLPDVGKGATKINLPIEVEETVWTRKKFSRAIDGAKQVKALDDIGVIVEIAYAIVVALKSVSKYALKTVVKKIGKEMAFTVAGKLILKFRRVIFSNVTKIVAEIGIEVVKEVSVGYIKAYSSSQKFDNIIVVKAFLSSVIEKTILIKLDNLIEGSLNKFKDEIVMLNSIEDVFPHFSTSFSKIYRNHHFGNQKLTYVKYFVAKAFVIPTKLIETVAIDMIGIQEPNQEIIESKMTNYWTKNFSKEVTRFIEDLSKNCL